MHQRHFFKEAYWLAEESALARGEK